MELWVEIVCFEKKKNKEDYLAYHHSKNDHGENRQYAEVCNNLK